MTRDTPPVWLLDVDGVVNAITKKPDRQVWPADAWITTEAEADGQRWPILAARPVLDFIRRVHQTDAAEIRWHTTWQKDTAGLAAALDLPHLPVQDAPEYADIGTCLKRDLWWKVPAVERVLRDEGRPVLWTDDDITWNLRRDRDRLSALGPLTLISPNERTGLTRKHLRKIATLLDLPALDGAA